MSELLDLDALDPEVRKIKIGGKEIEAYPLKIKSLFKIQKILLTYKTIEEPEKMLEAMDEIDNIMKSIIPEFDNIDLNFPQLMALIKFLSKQEEPTKLSETPQEEKGGST